MKIERNLTTMALSDSDLENLRTVLVLFEDLKGNLEEHGEECIENTADDRSVDIDELDDVIYYLKFFANAQKFILS